MLFFYKLHRLAIIVSIVAASAQLNAQETTESDALLRSELDSALEAPVLNTTPGPEYGDHTRNFALTTGIAGTPNGRIWAAWFNEDSEHAYLLAATSDDRGGTWSPLRLVIDPVNGKTATKRTLVGNLWTDPKGRLWLFFDQSMAFFDGRGGVWSSVCENPDSENPQWSEPTRIWHGATLNKPIVRSNGEWLLPISLWDKTKIRGVNLLTNQPYPNNLFPELDALRGAHVFVSSDEGLTWNLRGTVRFPFPDYDEHMIVERKDGSLWMLGRTRKGIYESFSTDDGKTWSEPQPSQIAHPHSRFFIHRLDSGNLLLVKHGRSIEETDGRSDLKAFISRDDGATWEGGLLLDNRQTSYPDGFQAKDGTIFISYDHDRVNAAEILLARFREEDVLAGTFQSPEAATQILINKATGPKPEVPVVENRLWDGSETDPRWGLASNWQLGNGIEIPDGNTESAFFRSDKGSRIVEIDEDYSVLRIVFQRYNYMVFDSGYTLNGLGKTLTIDKNSRTPFYAGITAQGDVTHEIKANVLIQNSIESGGFTSIGVGEAVLPSVLRISGTLEAQTPLNFGGYEGSRLEITGNIVNNSTIRFGQQGIVTISGDGKSSGSGEIIFASGTTNLERTASIAAGPAIVSETSTINFSANEAIATLNNMQVTGKSTWDFNNASQKFGTLRIENALTITLSGKCVLTFADSSSHKWSGNLAIQSFNPEEHSIRFGSTETSLSSDQLKRITINGQAAIIDAHGNLSSPH